METPLVQTSEVHSKMPLFTPQGSLWKHLYLHCREPCGITLQLHLRGLSIQRDAYTYFRVHVEMHKHTALPHPYFRGPCVDSPIHTSVSMRNLPHLHLGGLAVTAVVPQTLTSDGFIFFPILFRGFLSFCGDGILKGLSYGHPSSLMTWAP